MIRITLTPSILAATRFTISPLIQTCLVLHPHHNGNDPEIESISIEETLVSHRLHLLQTLRQICSDVTDYPPFTPMTSDPHVNYELERVAGAPSYLAEIQARKVAENSPWGMELLTHIRASGETYATRLALEIREFWEHSLASHWPTLAAKATADVVHRSNLMSAEGLGGTLDSLHPSIAYYKNELIVDSQHEVETSKVERITLCPSIATSCLLVTIDPWDNREMIVTYPANPHRKSHEVECKPSESLETVIGPSRSTLLLDLETPRTTTELARRQHLSLSTVSYHLKKLNQAGWVERIRIGKFVYYHRTKRAGI